MIRPSEMRKIIEGLVTSSDLETVKFCLEIYPQKPVLCLTSALTHALNEGNEEMIKLLLEYKVDYTTLKNCRIPAIHSALTAKRLDILEKLFELGGTLDKYRVWNYLSLRQAMRYKDKTFLL
ncbi:hypothetical protein TSAR_002896 [Trichomalopsis sarcophagae]|uniref:Uncharacterized protein n=1 Tax=Trichomalopsis sarcophagae TaxID=543379 RepID=A0A232EKJ8_9HYME|nr:hypothetical protein TSAR_002896 [Trichomalopsis sarcophagae]